MKLTWNNATKAQTLKAFWVDSSGHLVSAGTVSAGATHTEPNPSSVPVAMGFYGDWDGFQLVNFPADGVAVATANDGDPTSKARAGGAPRKKSPAKK